MRRCRSAKAAPVRTPGRAARRPCWRSRGRLSRWWRLVRSSRSPPRGARWRARSRRPCGRIPARGGRGRSGTSQYARSRRCPRRSRRDSRTPPRRQPARGFRRAPARPICPPASTQPQYRCSSTRAFIAFWLFMTFARRFLSSNDLSVAAMPSIIALENTPFSS